MKPRLTDKVLRGLLDSAIQLEASDANEWNMTADEFDAVKKAADWARDMTRWRAEQRKRRDTGPAPTTYWL